MSESKSNKELSRGLKASRGVFLHLGAFSFFLNLLALTGPLYMLQVYDRVLASQSIPTLIALTGLVVILYATQFILEWVRSNLFDAASSRFEEELGDRAADAAMQSSLIQPGKGSERPLKDLRTLRRFFSGPAIKLVFDAPWAPIFLGVLFLLHPYFGLWAIFGAVVLMILGFLNQTASSRLMQDTEQMERVSNQRAVEFVQNAEVIEAMGMREPLRKRWREAFDGSDNALASSGRILSGFTSGTKSFRMFLQSAILGLGAYLAVQGVSTPGAMVAASILMGRAIAPIEQLVGQWRSVVSARDAWKSLSKFLTATPEASEAMELPPLRGFVSLDSVYAAPPGMPKPVLKNVSFQLEPGDVLGILGPSAAGKSTLARVLTGIWTPASGDVRVDGADMSTFPRHTLGPQIGYLPQQADLLSGSIRENICRFAPDASPEGIIEAAKAANCHELILRQSEGYDTEIGHGGAFLSAGQRQRVGLARAIYGNPNIVILDEPNSNLDAPGDQALQFAIKGLKDRLATTLIIAHRPNAIMHCNKLLVLDEGTVKLFGPRDEVLEKIMPETSKVRNIR